MKKELREQLADVINGESYGSTEALTRSERRSIRSVDPAEVADAVLAWVASLPPEDLRDLLAENVLAAAVGFEPVNACDVYWVQKDYGPYAWSKPLWVARSTEEAETP
jgi:hypothetical protein